jgi:hypothetical protein
VAKKQKVEHPQPPPPVAMEASVDVVIPQLLDQLKQLVLQLNIDKDSKLPRETRVVLEQIVTHSLGTHHELPESLALALASILPYKAAKIKLLLEKIALPKQIAHVEATLEQHYTRLNQAVQETMAEQKSKYEEKLEHVRQISTQVTSPSPLGGDTKPQAKMPRKRFRWTPQVKECSTALIQTMRRLTSLVNQQNAIDKVDLLNVHDEKTKAYMRMMKAWPDGWMSLHQLDKELHKLCPSEDQVRMYNC